MFQIKVKLHCRLVSYQQVLKRTLRLERYSKTVGFWSDNDIFDFEPIFFFEVEDELNILLLLVIILKEKVS